MNNFMLSGKKYKNKNGTTNSISPCFLISSLNNSVALYVFPFLGLPFTITIFNKIQSLRKSHYLPLYQINLFLLLKFS